MKKDKKTKFMILLPLYAMYGLVTETVATALGGSLVGINGWHELTLMGHVSLWMSLVYFLAFPILNWLNDKQDFYKLPMIIQTLVGGFVIGMVELSSGIVLNLALGLNCWSYANEFANILGQVCLKNYIWFTLSYPLAIFLIDKTEYYVCEEHDEKLNYRFWDNYIDLITFK